jgi:hypothetical protein
MCNDTQSNHQQELEAHNLEREEAYNYALQQEEERERQLLTKEELFKWYFNEQSKRLTWLMDRSGDLTIAQIYLKDMGLPLDSIIEGL